MTFISIMGVRRRHVLLLPILITFCFTETESTSLEIVNNCSYTIWPALLTSGAATAALPTTGFTLHSGASFNLSLPSSWNGRVWARTLCTNASTGKNFSCFTADCGTRTIDCAAATGPTPPSTYAEFTLAGANSLDFYDVTLVDGFNLPMAVNPIGGGSAGGCRSVGCSADLNAECPKELRVVAAASEWSQDTVACMTPCKAFNNDLFCCWGNYMTRETCSGTVYSDYFKQRCPLANTFVDDDNRSYTCSKANYSIVFCPVSLNQTLAVVPAETPGESPLKEPTVLFPSVGKNRKIIIIASVASCVGIIVFVIAVLAGLWRRKRKRQQELQNSLLELEDGRRFMYPELVKITNNFASPIGAGGFGKVYHGILENDVQVAVKLLVSASGSTEFQNEIKLLMRAHHRNVVSFVGYCYDGKTMALVFEYVTNGNLQQHLTSSDVDNILSWKERLQIAVDAAQGLDYLHNGCKPPIIHRDIKPSNILLTEKMQAKICDFGVSKLLSTETATHTMTDHIRGTRGYFDPEYYTTGKLNKKSDLYIFGVVLLELITGKTAIIEDVEPEAVHICQWVRPKFEQTDTESIMDPRIPAGTYDSSSAWKAIEIAMKCVTSTSVERPDINVVYKELKECLEIEVPPETEIAKVAEVDESDVSSISSSVSAYIPSHIESESFLVHMKSHVDSEIVRNTY